MNEDLSEAEFSSSKGESIMSKPAARQGDMHTCPAREAKKPHGGGPITEGSTDVLIEGKPAARVGDQALCEAGGPDTIIEGASMVLINGRPAAILGSKTAHGGVVVTGACDVLIG